MMNDENPINNDLFNALVNGTLHEIHSLHKKDPRVLLGVTFQRDTPLHIAAREGHQDIVDWILQEKPSLAGARNKDGNTPLHEAAKCCNSELVDILLQSKKSSAYYSNKFGGTVLIIASKYGHAEAVKVLLRARSYNDASERRQSLRVAAYGRYPDKYSDYFCKLKYHTS
ncbi:ankyrin repeat-containing protein ITN1-like [Cryptomeria japonica]|uniref:ankyrin repeat-containing protein ITN1-like n=1 Tax=Cryptomeria japonica TaxID=3369 RepID=UPI0027DA0D5E|nr:ankyrin repeat-containing protein ITN1-like [Cryptomeria japonica]